MHRYAEPDEPTENGGEHAPGSDLRYEEGDDQDVEHPPGVVGVPQHLEEDVDQDGTSDDPWEAPCAAEDDHRVDGDQGRKAEGPREDALVVRAVDGAGEPRDPGSDGNGEK